MDRDELIRNFAEVIAGLQVPISLGGLGLGTAVGPVREIMGIGFGWRDADEYEAAFRRILDEEES